MKKSIVLLLISCSLLTIVSCKKKPVIVPEPSLPPIAQEGLNTFGFMFGKELWIPLSGLAAVNPGYPALTADYSKHNADLVLELVCRRQSPVLPKYGDSFILRYTNSDIKTGTFVLNNTNSRLNVLVTKTDQTDKQFESIEAGSITITRWDLKNRIGAGTFSMTIKEKTTGETVQVSEGRFDMVLGNQ